MLKEYRKRFVISAMLMVGLVLLLSFAFLAYSAYRTESENLENTMMQVLKPWGMEGDGMFGGFRKFGGHPQDRPDGNFQPPELPDGRKPGAANGEDLGISDENITTVLVNSSTGDISILSESEDLDEAAISDAVKAIEESSGSFGRIAAYSLIYYRETTMDGYKIALTDSSYLTSRVASQIGVLAVLFIGIMGLMLLVSMHLAKNAAKPMEDAIDMERQFVADISHDLKTPISVVLANNSILKSSPDSTVADQMQWIDSSDEAVRSMRTLVEEMLALSSLESLERRSAQEKTRVDLSSVAEKCELQMESVAYERGVMIDSEIDESVFTMADPDHIERIVSGLIENALKYEPLGGKIEIRLKKNRKKAILSIQNHGSRISEDDLPHIFERFYRGDKARSDKKGYGLGLPIIKQMCELCSAQISAESSEEIGTQFTVTFETAE